MCKKQENGENKTIYLQLIQEPICRMSTVSSIYKGFASAIVGGIAVISYKEINLAILLLSFLPVLAFAIIDIYYLKLEKKFRFLYNEVRTGKHIVDFSLDIKSIDDKKSNSTIWHCMISPSIYLFYPIIFIALIGIIIIKINT